MMTSTSGVIEKLLDFIYHDAMQGQTCNIFQSMFLYFVKIAGTTWVYSGITNKVKFPKYIKAEEVTKDLKYATFVLISKFLNIPDNGTHLDLN